MRRLETRRLAVLALVAAGAISMSGCGGMDDEMANASRSEVCRADADCSGEQACQSGYCTRLNAELDGVSFEFVPSDSSSYSPQIMADMSVRAGEPLDFSLEKDVKVEGAIAYSGSSDTAVTSPGGALTFKRISRADTLFDVQTQVTKQGNFETMLLPGRYDLVFAPKNYPSRVWRNVSFGAKTDLGELSVPSELATIQGKVVYHTGSGSGESEPRPVEDADVLAVSRDGRFTTTFGTTTSENAAAGPGRFELRALPNTGPYDIIVDPGSETMLPKVRFSNVFEAADGYSDLTDEPLDLGTFGTATRQAIQSSLSLEGAVSANLSDRTIDWPGVKVVADAKIKGGREFRRDTTPDDDGRIAMTLMPANYVLWLYPPSNSPLASKRLALDADQLITGRLGDWTWKPKPRFEGQITDQHGEPVANAHLAFRPEGLEYPNYRDRLKVSTTTDANGRFVVRLDRFDHQVVVRPPAESGLPRHRWQLSREQLIEGESPTVRLPEPLLLKGSVRGAPKDDAPPLSGTSVRAYIERDGEKRTLGKATTTDNGQFRMIVPATKP